MFNMFSFILLRLMLGVLFCGHMVAYINLFSSYWVSIHGRTHGKRNFYLHSFNIIFIYKHDTKIYIIIEKKGTLFVVNIINKFHY